jgi:methylmalonyl-CoA mutase N-terminal domain/subunit
MIDKSKLSEMIKTETRWLNNIVKPTIDKFPERQQQYQTLSDITIDRIYTPASIPEFDYSRDLGFPGEYPFTRGVQPTMYRGRLWTMRQYAGYGSAQDTNRRYKYLMAQGQTGLSVAFDLPTQLGYDSDNPKARGEVGKCGVAISSLQDLQVLFDGINLAKVSTSMTINAPASMLLAMYVAVAQSQHQSPAQLTGTTQNDILKEYIARGAYIYPPKPSMRLTTDIFDYCAKVMPKWNTISISGYHIREAGATAVQEVAFTLANGITYVEAAIARGLHVDTFAPRLAFFFNAHIDFFEEIAKFRAARRLWAKLMRDRFNARNPRSLMLRFHTQTAGCSLTAQQPENNIIRVTLQALASVIGGTQSLHTNSMDEAYALPAEKAVRIALRTQQVIAHESGVTNTIDPFGGAYFVEFLTTRIEDEAMRYIEKIDNMGGMLNAIERGWVQKEISDSAYKYQKAIEDQNKIVVGVNKFQMHEKQPRMELLSVDPQVEIEQRERLQQLRAERDNTRVETIRSKLASSADSDINLLPILIEAVKAHVTLGEICDTLREVFGEYRAPTVV